jgi:hypothetical protein
MILCRKIHEKTGVEKGVSTVLISSHALLGTLQKTNVLVEGNIFS